MSQKERRGIYFRCGVEPPSSSLLTINEQVPLIWFKFMAKNFHNGTNIIAKPYTIFLREEILEFFMAPTVKTHLSVLLQKIPAL